MDTLSKLEELYKLRDTTNDQILAIEKILGGEPGEVKQRKKRGPNKPKTDLPLNTV